MENNSLYDSLRKKRREEMKLDADVLRGDKELLQEKRNTNLLVAGATPLLAGLLVGGDIGDAAEIAAGSLAKEQKRHQDQDDTLMSYLMKRESARDKASGSGSGRLYKVRNDDGTLTYRTHEDAVNQSAALPRRSVGETMEITEGKGRINKKYGKGYKTAEDPISGKVTKIYMGEEDIPNKEVFETPKSFPKNWDKRKETMTQSAVKDFNSVSKKHKEAMLSLNGAKQNLASGGKFAEKLGVMGLVTTIEKRLSDYDRAFYIGEISWLRAFAERIRKEKEGTLPKYIVEEAKKMIERNLANVSGHIEKQRSDRISQLSAAGIDAKYADSRFGARSSSKSSTESETIRVSNGKEYYDIPRKDLRDAKKDGFKVVE